MQPLPYHNHITGIVRSGQGQGKKMAAPTANLDPSLAEEKHLPKGLYVCLVHVNGKQYDGLLYYGVNFFTEHDCLEVHLLNFSGNLYGQEITAAVRKFLRPPMIFTTAAALQQQIARDLAEATVFIALPPGGAGGD